MSQPHAKRLRGATTSATSATSEPPALVYIFLDIDGVLNCWPSRIAAERLPGEAEQALALAGAPSLLARLKLIIERTGAQIVLSSTWRIDSTAIVEERLRSVGLSLLGATPQLSEEEPGDEHFALTQGPGAIDRDQPMASPAAGCVRRLCGPRRHGPSRDGRKPLDQPGSSRADG
jgi:hypothetical protein